jgi:hypothetical protein
MNLNVTSPVIGVPMTWIDKRFHLFLNQAVDRKLL